MNHQQAAEIIKQHNIPRSTVARLSKMRLPDLSGWLNGRTNLVQETIDRIVQVVADIAKVVQVKPMKVNLKDCANVAKLIVAVNDGEMQLSLFDQPAEPAPDFQSLRVRPA